MTLPEPQPAHNGLVSSRIPALATLLAAALVVPSTAVPGTSAAVASAGPASAVAATTGALVSARNPAKRPAKTWSTRRLAAQVLFGCTDSRDTTGQRRMARQGVGGVVLLGANPPGDLRSRLSSVKKASSGVPITIASDEEGGVVQRLRPLLGPLPSAATMGGWSRAKVRRTAQDYGQGMRGVGVDMNLAPVADLAVAGRYIGNSGRAFSTSPKRVARHVTSFATGLRRAKVTPVLKHWPGHGHAADTHTQAAVVPSLSSLRKADLRPFNYALRRKVRAVMVAHVQSAGLTATGVPATQSRSAMRYLRKQAGPRTVIITDSMSMAAASSARGLTATQATVRALQAGADWAMVCTGNMAPVISAVVASVRAGEISRKSLIRRVGRIVSLKQQPAG